MTEATFQDTLDSLEELLEQERTALINGELDQLGELLSRKVELVDKLNASEVEFCDMGKDLREECFRCAWHPFEQDMPAR